MFTKDIHDNEAEKYANQMDYFMSDLTPSDMLTVEVGGGESHSFYIKPESFPCKIKIAYSITS